MQTCGGNDLFYWPPGHSVRVTQNAEVVLFSPQQEHMEVVDHMLKQMAAPDFAASGTHGPLGR